MSACLHAARRGADLELLAGGEVVDVVVVGGGITGAGIALDAASRGLSVALLERRDLAFGTSRWSSKLVHGGLRYLAQGDVGLAYESAVERGILLRDVAPHLLRPIPFLTPLDAAVDRRSAAMLRVGGRLGDSLRVAARTSRRDLPPPRRISALEARRLAPALRSSGLRAGQLSWDCQLEDDAVTLRPSRGSHLLVRAERLGDPRALVSVKVPGERGRWVFAIPRGDGLVTLGLTDVPAPGEPVDEPRPDPAEEVELLDRVSAALDVPLTTADVVGRYAGLRPLAVFDGDGEGATADLSRRHAIVTDEDSGAIAIVGGKLTTYRRMAEDAVNRVTHRPCRTARLPLVGAASSASLRSVAAPERLVRRYGTEAPAVVALADGRPELLEPLGEGVPACGAELLWAVRHELALGVDDLVDRRTRLGLVPEWRDAGVAAAAELVGAPANVNGAG